MSRSANGKPTQPDTWTWPEERWRPIVEKVRAGRSLKPTAWPGGARCAVALSFDSDHETLTLRWGDRSPGKLSQGQYGARAAMPRILKLLERYDAPATFFVPAVTAILYPEEQRAVVSGGHEIGIHSWIHELNSALPPEDERDLQMRAADKLEEISGQRPVGIRTPSLGLLPAYPRHHPGDGAPLRLLTHGRRRALRAPRGQRADGGGGAPRGVDPRRRAVLDDGPVLGPSALHPALRRAGRLPPRVRRRLRRGGAVPPHDAPALHRPPIADPGARGADPPHPLPCRGLVRDHADVARYCKEQAGM